MGLSTMSGRRRDDLYQGSSFHAQCKVQAGNSGALPRTQGFLVLGLGHRQPNPRELFEPYLFSKGIPNAGLCAPGPVAQTCTKSIHPKTSTHPRWDGSTCSSSPSSPNKGSCLGSVGLTSDVSPKLTSRLLTKGSLTNESSSPHHMAASSYDAVNTKGFVRFSEAKRWGLEGWVSV